MKIPYTNRKNRTIRLRQRLSFKLTAWVAGALILLTSLAVFTAYHLLEREAIRSMLQTGYWFSDTVKRATRFSMLKDQRDSVHATIEAIGSQEGVEVIRVFNKQGRIMFSSRKAETGHLVDLQAEACYACHFRDRPLSKLPQAQRSRIFSAAAHGGSAHRVLGVITPIYSEPACYTDPCHAHPPGQTVLGVLDVGLSLENADHQVAASTRRVVLFAVVLCLVIATVLLGITYLFLNRPLSRLLHATRQITQGDYDHPVQASSHDEIGELAGAFEVMRQSVRDKTEALEESRRRFQTLFEQVPCYISVQDRDFRLVAANRMFDRDFGAKIGEYCFSLYKGRDQKCEGCAVEQCFQDGGVHWAEERVKDQDGTVRHFLNLAAPITDARGQVVHVMEMATDVTPLRRLEEELRVSEEKYRLFFNNDPNAIFVFAQEDWRILDANQRAVSDYGYSYEALLALTFLELADPADQARLREFLSERVNVLPRLHMLCADGRVFLVNLRASYGEHMGRPAVIAATADISETLKAEEQLVQAAKMATLGEMSAGVAHELNQPLSVLATGGHLLARQTQKGAPPDPALVAQVAREIEEQVGRATRIINHLREFGRKAEVSRSLIDVTEPIAGVFQLLGQQMRVHDIAVHLDLPAGLPPVWADKNRMEQVFINLLLNARDAIDERRQAGDRRGGEISVAAREENGQAVVMVRDNGIGIPPALRSRIFEPFFTTKEVGRGTGLGLSISYGIVRDYGGTITVESCPGQGSCFRVSFPLAAEEAA